MSPHQLCLKRKLIWFTSFSSTSLMHLYSMFGVVTVPMCCNFNMKSAYNPKLVASCLRGYNILGSLVNVLPFFFHYFQVQYPSILYYTVVGTMHLETTVNQSSMLQSVHGIVCSVNYGDHIDGGISEGRIPFVSDFLLWDSGNLTPQIPWQFPSKTSAKQPLLKRGTNIIFLIAFFWWLIVRSKTRLIHKYA